MLQLKGSIYYKLNFFIVIVYNFLFFNLARDRKGALSVMPPKDELGISEMFETLTF